MTDISPDRACAITSYPGSPPSGPSAPAPRTDTQVALAAARSAPSPSASRWRGRKFSTTTSAAATSRRDHRPARRVPQVQRQAAPVAVDREEVRGVLAVERRPPAPGVVADAGALDLEHVGAEVGEHEAAVRAGQHPREVEHLQAGERPAAGIRRWPARSRVQGGHQCGRVQRIVGSGRSAAVTAAPLARPRPRAGPLRAARTPRPARWVASRSAAVSSSGRQRPQLRGGQPVVGVQPAQQPGGEGVARADRVHDGDRLGGCGDPPAICEPGGGAAAAVGHHDHPWAAGQPAGRHLLRGLPRAGPGEVLRAHLHHVDQADPALEPLPVARGVAEQPGPHVGVERQRASPVLALEHRGQPVTPGRQRECQRPGVQGDRLRREVGKLGVGPLPVGGALDVEGVLGRAVRADVDHREGRRLRRGGREPQVHAARRDVLPQHPAEPVGGQPGEQRHRHAEPTEGDGGVHRAAPRRPAVVQRRRRPPPPGRPAPRRRRRSHRIPPSRGAA